MNTSVQKLSLAEKSVGGAPAARPNLKSVNDDPFPQSPKSFSETKKDIQEKLLLHKPANDENINSEHEIPTIDESNSANLLAGEPTLAKKLEKLMEVLTAIAMGTNAFSVALKLGDKAGFAKTMAKPFEKIAMLFTKAHASGFSVKILEKAINERDITLLLAGFGKLFQVAFAGVDNFLLAGGFQVAFDVFQPGLSKIIGLDKFNSFGHSAAEYFKAFKTVMADFVKEPLGYLKLSPSKGVERALIPAAISAFIGTIGGMKDTGNRALKVLFGFLRHVTGGIAEDLVFAKLENNKDMNTSGKAYIMASAVDALANTIKNPKKEDITHQVATIINFMAELFFLKGLDKKHDASEPALAAMAA